MGSLLRELARVVYEAILPLKAFNAVPRFGHTANVTAIFVESEDGQSNVVDYALGTIFVCAFCLACFVAWLLIVTICKCLGRRAGICAGFPLQDSEKYGQPSKKTKTWKILMLACSAIIVFNGFLFMFRGAMSISNVFSDMRDATSGFAELADLIVDTADDVIAFGESTVDLRDVIVDLIDDGICNAGDNMGGGTGAIQEEFDTQASTVVDLLTALQDFSKNSLVDLRDTFAADFDSWVERLEEYTITGENYVRPIYIAAPVVAFGFLLGLGSYLSWKAPHVSAYFKVQTWLILPLFSILFIVIGITISVIGSVLVANSDVCLAGESRSPEGLVKAILDLQGDSIGDLTREVVDYYAINGCDGEFSRKTDVEELIVELNAGLGGINDLNTILQNDQATIEGICGGAPGSLDGVKGTLIVSAQKFSEFVSISENAVDILQCERLNDIFVDLFHDLLCTSTPYSLTWMFSTMMSVFILGMFMILFRGALLPSEGSFDDESRYDYDESGRMYHYNGDRGVIEDGDNKSYDERYEHEPDPSPTYKGDPGEYGVKHSVDEEYEVNYRTGSSEDNFIKGNGSHDSSNEGTRDMSDHGTSKASFA